MTTQTLPALTVVFSILAVVVAALAAWGAARATAPAGRAGPRLALAFGVAAAWMAAWALVARSGALLDLARRPPPLVLMMAATLAAGIGIGASPLGGRLARGLPLAALVGFQAFRLPLELVMHGAARAGAMPVQMSFSGWNFDVVTGASAAVVAGLLLAGRAPRWLVGAWNGLGAALLANIVAIAAASTPLIHAFGTDPAAVNTWIATAPFVWLPTVFVTCAIAGQVVIARRLLADARVPRVEAAAATAPRLHRPSIGGGAT
jgi:hypothetical protein